MIWCTVCGNYHSTLLACGGVSQFPEPRVAKFKTAYIDEINEPTKMIVEIIVARDKEWVAGVKELIYGCYSGNCKHKLTCSVHSFSCQAFEQLKNNMGVL